MTTNVQTQNMKQVRFAPDTKTHDGLRLDNDQFNSMILNFFKAPIITNVDQIPKGPNHLFRTYTDDLIRRIHARKRATPVLPGGGGGCVKVSHTHVPYLKSLLSWLAKAAPTPGSRRWMVSDPSVLGTQDGIVFVKELVDGLI